MRTIAVTSGKGGVGKSTISLNLGITLSQLGSKAIVFDCDFALANLDLFLQVQPEFNLRHVLSGEKSIKEIVATGPNGVGIIAGASAIGSLIHAGPKRLNLFLEQIKELERFCDFMIFDTGAGIDSKVMTILRAAHDVALVTTPDPASVTDSYAVSKVLFRQRPESKVYVLANQVKNEFEGYALHRTLNTISQKFLKQELDYLGHVRRDEKAAALVRRRMPFAGQNPPLDASNDLEVIGQQIRKWKKPIDSFYENLASASAQAVEETFSPILSAA